MLRIVRAVDGRLDMGNLDGSLQLHLFGGRLAEDPFGEELRSLIRAKAHGIEGWQPSAPGGQWSDAPCCQERTRSGDHGYDDRPSSKTCPCGDRCSNAPVVPRSGTSEALPAMQTTPENREKKQALRRLDR